MIWTDDKIKRLMSMGMMHGGRDTDPTGGPAGGGQAGKGDDDNGGGGGDLSGLGQELSVDLGGGVTVGIDSNTGAVTSTTGGDPGGLEGALAQVQQPSAFGQFLNSLTGKQKGAAIGAIGGALFGIGPLAGAQLGATIGKRADTGLTQQAPGQTQEQARAQQQQAPGGVSPAGVSPGGLSGLGGTGGLGGEGGQLGDQQALQLAAAGRQSGIAGAPTQPQVNPFLGRQPQFLNQLPQVNLGQFPNALGRV